MSGSATSWVRQLLAGPRRVAPLVHTGPHAAYLDLDGTCLAVLASGAARVPCGVRTDEPRLPSLDGGTAVVRAGAVELLGPDGGLAVVVTGGVDARVPELPTERVEHAERLLRGVVGDRLAPLREELPTGPLALLATGDPAAARGLLGLGGGLTPLGDDVLCGWLAASVATGHPALAEVAAEVARWAPERTTTLSVTLLACATRGEALPEFDVLLAGLAGDHSRAVAASVDRLLSIGHTSGAGLVLGALLALESRSASAPAPAPGGVPG